MEYLKMVIYSFFLISAIFLALFNMLYSVRVRSVSQSLGFETPKFLRRALDVNMIVSFVITFVVAYALAKTLVSIDIQSLL